MTEDGIAARTRALAGALVEGDFARLRVRDGETEIEIRRLQAPRLPSVPAPTVGPSDEARGDRHGRGELISSDVVGILRHLRPAIAEGQELDGDRELAYVETLGIRNAVRSRGPGRVSTVFVTEGQAVEYGQPLFAIER